MRASELIDRLAELIEQEGDCYVMFPDERSYYGLNGIADIEVIPFHETQCFCFKEFTDLPKTLPFSSPFAQEPYK